jgi:RNA polymerase sigma-70 factor (ECF subfamily)
MMVLFPIASMAEFASNEELGAALSRAEDAAFDEFARLYGPRLRAYLLAHGLPLQEAESLAVSLVTDVALKATHFNVERGNPFDAWVFTLARHGLADWYRRQARTVITAELRDEVFEDVPTARDLIDAVREAMSRLSSTDQEILRRRDMGYRQGYQEIADELQIEPGAARVRRLRALRRLEKTLRCDERVGRFLTSRNKKA